MRSTDRPRQCRSCIHFRNDAEFLESAFSGLKSLSSAFASVRADDGLCLRHDRYLSACSFCADFSPKHFAAHAARAGDSVDGDCDRRPGHSASAANAPEMTTASTPAPCAELPAATSPGTGLFAPRI